MHSRLLPLLLLAGLCAGCTSYRAVAVDDGAELTSRSLESVRMRLADGRTVHAVSVRLDVDSTSWVDPVTREFRSVPTVDVFWVDQVNRVKGGLQGAAVSFLAVTALATVEQAVGNQNILGGDFGRDLGTGSRVGMLAAPIGALAGSAVGARRRSVFTVGPVYVSREPSVVPRDVPRTP